MADPQGINRVEQSLMGVISNFTNNARVGLDVDTSAIQKLSEEFKKLTQNLLEVKKQLDAIKASADKAAPSVGSVASTGPKGSIGATPMAGGITKTPAVEPATATGGGGEKPPSIGSTPMQGMLSPKAFGGMQVAAFGAAAIQQGISTMDARIERGTNYAITADRMSVMYQQMTGLSQQQVQDRYREPLTRYRLGAGGINTLLGLQAQYGINAQQQASSVEAMRTYTGYSMTAEGAASIMQNLTSAPVANRMFMMMGGGMIGVGGKQNTMQSTLQRIVQAAGLTDERRVTAAKAQGSLIRGNMANMGISGELQDLAIQYAEQNVQYKKKGGKGMYDASNKNARELMGIESNYATQAEETDRLRVKRDEQFYSRQADNYADLERQTQTLTKAFGALEDKLSGLIGGRISSKVMTGQIGGTLGGIGGAILGNFLLPGAGGFIGGALGSGLGKLIAGGIGDGPPGKSGAASPTSGTGAGTAKLTSVPDSQIKVPTGSGMRSLDEVKNMSSFKGMNPTMQQRLLKMMRANPRVGFGGGVRSPEEQKRLFLNRYRRTNNKKTGDKDNWFWDGSYWEKTDPNAFDAAPPGRSMHALGLAADLTGDLDWVAAHSREFGLVNFADVNGEKHHVQPDDIPKGFSEYVQSGAKYGYGPFPPDDVSGSGSLVAPEPNEHFDESGSASASGSAGRLNSASISERVSSDSFAEVSGSGSSTTTSAKTSRDSSIGDTSVVTVPAGAMDPVEIAKLLYGAGFRGDQIPKMLAVAYKESSWNPRNHTVAERDDSYGLFQINMKNDLGPTRRARWGLSSNEELFDPVTNVRVAKSLFDNSGYGPWNYNPPSGPGSGPTANSTKWEDSVAAAKAAGYGDPFIPDRGVSGASGATTINGGNTFHITVPVTITGSGNQNTDIQRIAKEMARAIQREMEMMKLRSN